MVSNVDNLIPKARACFNRHPNELVWTEGLQWFDQKLYESSSDYVEMQFPASLQQLELNRISNTASVIQRFVLGAEAEGLTRYHQELLQLVNRSSDVLVYQLNPFKQLQPRVGATRGVKRRWGLCFNGQQFFLSDGTAVLKIYDVLNPDFFGEPSDCLTVTLYGEEFANLNTLEFANGFIYAAVRDGDQSNQIVKIDSKTGAIVADINAENLRKQLPENNKTIAKELNGIAYGYSDQDGDIFYLTGKLWSKIFEVTLIQATD